LKLLRFATYFILSLVTISQSTLTFAKQQELHEKPPPNEQIQGFSIRSTQVERGTEFEVIGFESENAKQTRQIINQLKDEISVALKNSPNAKFEVHVRMATDSPESSALDYEAFALGDEIASLDKRIQLSQSNMPVDSSIRKNYSYKRFFEKSYRMTFALLRGAASWGITTYYLYATPHLPMEAALGIGFLTGSMSFGLQYWSEPFYKWASKSTGWMAKTFDRYRNPDSASFWNKAESYFKLYWVEVIYVGLLHAAIIALGHEQNFQSLDAIKHVLVTALWGFSQDTWDLTFTETRSRLERLRTLSKDQIDFRTNFKYLGVAGTSMALLMAQSFHTPNIEYAYVGMGAIGGLAYLRSHYKSKKLAGVRPKKEAPLISCKILVRALGH
jgi:hypothetical protein